MQGPSNLQRAQVEHSVQDVVAMGSVLSKPRWARIWHSVNILTNHEQNYLDDAGAPTASDIIEETGIPQTTVYEDLSTLVNIGALEKLGETESGATKYRARGGHLMAHTGDPDGQEDYLTPVTIGVVGSAYENEDVELFIERNGYNVLHHCCLQVRTARDESNFESLAEVGPELSPADAHMIEDTIRETREQLDKETLWNEY